MTFECVECGLEVRPRQEAVSCDWCEKWNHRTCGTGISRFRELEARANTPKLRSLVGYMDRTWFGHRLFNVESWCVYRNTVRTNNDVEGYHHRLNSRAGNNALTFYRLIPVLRKESEMVHYHVRVLTDGQGGRTTRPTYRRVEARVNKLWDRYSAEELTTNAFLKACARVYSPCNVIKTIEEVETFSFSTRL